VARSQSAPVSAGKTTVLVEHLPVKLIEALDAFFGDLKAKNGGYGKINIEFAEGDVKRFETLGSFLMSAL